MEAELAVTRAAIQQSEAERHQRSAERTQIGEDPSTNALLQTLLETLTATSLSNSAKEVLGLRDWKPPTWDSRVETFRDYLIRLRSSYWVRSATKPTLS
jgi:hypothetical protein